MKDSSVGFSFFKSISEGVSISIRRSTPGLGTLANEQSL